jgi:hypothetical protein
MARTRSPNYPYIGLPAAIERVKQIYEKEHQNRMSRNVVADHLGFGSLNGVSLSVISALSKYGLLATMDEDLQVSDDALTILVDPPDSADRVQAIRRAALKPDLFSELHKHFGGTVPSDVNLLAYLQKNGFTANAAALAAKSFRETMQLISGQPSTFHANDGKSSEGSGMQVEREQRDEQKPPVSHIKIAGGERELTTGLLSKNASFRLIVSGEVGVKEIERLIAKLELDKEILAESDPPTTAEDSAVDPPSPAPKQGGSFFITQAQKTSLREQGYSDEQITKMKPTEAHRILGLQ